MKATKGDILWTVIFFVMLAVIAFFPWPASATELPTNGNVRIVYNGAQYSWNGTFYAAVSSTAANVPSTLTMMYTLKSKYTHSAAPLPIGNRIAKTNDYSDWTINLGTEAEGGLNYYAHAHCYGGLAYAYSAGSTATVTVELNCDRIDGNIL